MTNLIRRIGTFLGILCTVAMFGCASADDGALPPADEATEASEQALAEAALDADAADCGAGAETGSYEEFASMLENDGSLEAASTCRRVCACCRRGNRFCCSHCRFCSGPIGPYGVSTGELAH